MHTKNWIFLLFSFFVVNSATLTPKYIESAIDLLFIHNGIHSALLSWQEIKSLQENIEVLVGKRRSRIRDLKTVTKYIKQQLKKERGKDSLMSVCEHLLKDYPAPKELIEICLKRVDEESPKVRIFQLELKQNEKKIRRLFPAGRRYKRLDILLKLSYLCNLSFIKEKLHSNLFQDEDRSNLRYFNSQSGLSLDEKISDPIYYLKHIEMLEDYFKLQIYQTFKKKTFSVSNAFYFMKFLVESLRALKPSHELLQDSLFLGICIASYNSTSLLEEVKKSLSNLTKPKYLFIKISWDHKRPELSEEMGEYELVAFSLNNGDSYNFVSSQKDIWNPPSIVDFQSIHDLKSPILLLYVQRP